MKKLTEGDVAQRLIRGRNLEQLHDRAQKRITILKKENKQLKARVKELEERDRDKGERIEALSLQFEQMKNKLFGKKPFSHRIREKKEKTIRDTSSYCRPVPTSVTTTELHPVHACAHCQGELKRKSTIMFFEEDIPLPIPKMVTKHEVEVGYCTSCRKQSSGILIPSKKSILGDNVKKYVCTLSITNRLSHTQIQEHLKDVFDLSLSRGEVGNILQTEADSLRPDYQSLKESILNQTGVHYDETGWKVQKEEAHNGKYAWVATGTENHDTVFSLGRNRGQGNIHDLGTAKIGITDDYGAYKNAFEEHQLCWAHPQRKFRDLAESKEFEGGKKKHVMTTYQQFSQLYHSLQKKIGDDISPYLKKRFKEIFDQIARMNTKDPAPLAKLKNALRRNKEEYFTFLDHPGIPLDNNKAERALRHLVIKRKISFGSRTSRGAETTSILASVILSLKWNDPENWFTQYLALGG